MPAAAVAVGPGSSHLRFPIGRRRCETPDACRASAQETLRPAGTGLGPTLPPTPWRVRLRVRMRRCRRSVRRGAVAPLGGRGPHV